MMEPAYLDCFEGAIAQRHHRYKKSGGYPKLKYLESNGKKKFSWLEKLTMKISGEDLADEEVIFLSKVLAIIDFHDSISVRRNTKWSKDGKTPVRPSSEQARESLLKEYADLDLRYQGDKFPEFYGDGIRLIHDFYEAGIFGKRNPLNPFPEPYSFIYKKE